VGESVALDLILTGRGVGADEALRIGLANRVVPEGAAREAAVTLAHELAALPQTCLRQDRASVLEQAGLSHDEAMANEWRHGMQSLQGDLSGVARFVGGAGRHGAAT
jgi:enoyl-CoA hydratase